MDQLAEAKQKAGRTLEVAGECPQCEGTGILISRDNVATLCPCGAYQRQKNAALYAAARIPRKFANKSIESFEVKQGDHKRRTLRDAAHAWANTFTSSEERGIRLYGKTGCGKTHLAVGMLKTILGRGFSGCYYNVTDLLLEIRSTYNRESDAREFEILEEINEFDLVVFDDLGVEKPSAWVMERLYLIFNRRYELCKPMLITTNCTMSELSERIGERIASRIMEMTDSIGAFPEEDYRYANLS